MIMVIKSGRIIDMGKKKGHPHGDAPTNNKPKICYNSKNIKEQKYGLFAFGRQRLSNC